MAYSLTKIGEAGTLKYCLFFKKNNTPISPFHDIPLWADKNAGIANMVVEIPRGQQAKLEISRDIFLNPIKQDVKNGKLRYVAMKYPFNYGALPQTWENPCILHPDTNASGDNDPVDVCNISSLQYNTGDVIQVKILGTYAMIDEGETDWKILAVDVNDEKASQMNDVEDIDKVIPGTTKAVYEFLRDYKIPDGKPANVFAFESKPQNRDYAIKVIEEAHKEWVEIIQDKISSETKNKVKISTACTQVECPFTVKNISEEVLESKI
ncbi:inorganic pyrophosphatase-like [Schistocerca gregaria]|uniref:inorganic pyrophosphatase-like n=1 Tax=Schistocerca gregaria TaxID=7010 RepID=UPI00211EDA1C|nr:inorganic pyrophosphatase-like [Schistocerca gregaria]